MSGETFTGSGKSGMLYFKIGLNYVFGNGKMKARVGIELLLNNFDARYCWRNKQCQSSLQSKVAKLTGQIMLTYARLKGNEERIGNI